jgi:quercetin dioxygenase-like cupin family protein
MTRTQDVLVGAIMGALATATIVAFAVPATMDPVRLSPQYYTVRLDNARVRVLEFRLKPGEKEVMHSHPEGIVFALADATVKTYLPDGTSVAYPSKQGDVMWRDAVTHSGENVGSTEAHYLAVELKGCPK